MNKETKDKIAKILDDHKEPLFCIKGFKGETPKKLYINGVIYINSKELGI